MERSDAPGPVDRNRAAVVADRDLCRLDLAGPARRTATLALAVDLRGRHRRGADGDRAVCRQGAFRDRANRHLCAAALGGRKDHSRPYRSGGAAVTTIPPQPWMVEPATRTLFAAFDK